jgi:L-histidine N-alpha-methyltransferase
VDLKKEPHVLEAAYNDAEGIISEFNRNILKIVNRMVDANFDPGAFRHQAIWNEDDARIEMHLIAETRQEIFLGAGDIAITVEPGETIWTESLYKFTRSGAQGMLEEAKMRLDAWHTDSMFGLALAAPDGS